MKLYFGTSKQNTTSQIKPRSINVNESIYHPAFNKQHYFTSDSSKHINNNAFQPLFNDMSEQSYNIKPTFDNINSNYIRSNLAYINRNMNNVDNNVLMNKLKIIENKLLDHETFLKGNKLLSETVLLKNQANQSLIDYNLFSINENKKLILENEEKIAKNEETLNNNSSEIVKHKEMIQINYDELSNLKNNVDNISHLIKSTNSSDVLQKTLSNVKKAVCQIAFTLNDYNYIGSGWFYTASIDDLSKGYYVTAAHCVMEIMYGRVYKTTNVYIQNPITDKWIDVDIHNIYVDGVADIALIQTNIDFTNHPEYCLHIAENSPHYGSQCYVVGNPGNLDEDSISCGCVRDPHYTEPTGTQITDSILVSASGMGGSSGGPILNKDGNVIGMYTFGLGYGLETFGGGSNSSVLKHVLPVLKQLQNNKNKLYLGFIWQIPSPFDLEYYYNSTTLPSQNIKGSTISFETMGVETVYIDKASPFRVLMDKYNTRNFIFLSCIILHTNETEFIQFGRNEEQFTPGVLLYYPLGTFIKLKFIKKDEKIIREEVIQLNITYNDVDETLDGFLQGGAKMEMSDIIINQNNKPIIKLNKI